MSSLIKEEIKTSFPDIATPVLLIVFNRPDKTRTALEIVKKAGIKNLYIAADGPRENNQNDIEKCKEVRELVEKSIDWECEVKYHFQKSNMGCGKNVSSAITWFFENVEAGIILEDDCNPVESFFQFSNLLLEEHKYNHRVMCISGNNFRNQSIPANTYHYSKYMHCWGWATWRRAWKKYNFEIDDLTVKSNDPVFLNILGENNERKFWLTVFKNISEKKIDTWDYQWQYSIFANNGLVIIPDVNLVTNNGFGSDATHTKSENGKGYNLKSAKINFPLIHPKDISVDKVGDKKVFKLLFYTSFYQKVKNKFNSFFNK